MYIRRRFEDEITLLKTTLFPAKRIASRKHLRYEAVVSIGGNVGDTKRMFHKLLRFFQRTKLAIPIQTSSIVKNPPFGYLDQPFFYNGIVVLRTNLRPKSLLRHLLRVEKRFGRKRSFPNAPRTLDLDIVFFDDRRIDTPTLTIPHPQWYKRKSVLIPLLDVVS